jgi:branched-chain amino acid aminotransferase
MDEIRGEFFLFNDQVLPVQKFNPQVINFGTTIYELIKVVNCVPTFVEKYLLRVKNSLKLINKSLWFDQKAFLEKIKRIIELNCVTDIDHLKILICFENQLYNHKDLFLAYFAEAPVPTPEQYSNGVKTITLNAKRLNPNAKIFLPDLRKKSETLIEKLNIYEVILLSDDNTITEGSRSNIFFVKNNSLYTAELKQVLPGITRSNVIELARKNSIDVYETTIKYEEISNFEAAFLTGTSRKIVPVKNIDDITFDVQHNVVKKLMQLYDQLIDKYVTENRNNWLCQNC